MSLLSVSLPLWSASLSLSSSTLPWVLGRLAASWSESDVLRRLVVGLLARMVPLWVVGKVERVGGMLKAMADDVEDGDDGGWRRTCVWENMCAHTQQ